MSVKVGLTWSPQRGHRGEQQITDAVTVHTSTTPETEREEMEQRGKAESVNNDYLTFSYEFEHSKNFIS